MNLLNIINYLGSNGRECRRLIRLCRLFFFSFLFFVMREKTIWFDTPGEFSPLSGSAKENYSLHSLREKSIIPNKSQSCCPFFWRCGAGPSAMSILCHLLCFFFEVRPAGRQLSDPDTGDVHNRHCGYPFIKQRLILKTWRRTSASADLFV